MTPRDAFGGLIAVLEGARIAYMLVGSFASSYHGVPRATQDIDLVVDPTEPQLRVLIRSLPEDRYYADIEAALDALRRRTMFNILDMATGWKVDLIVRKDRPFSREEFSRRMPVEFQGRTLFIASAEDVVLSKLEWARAARSRRQLEDVASVLKVRAVTLDLSYIENWVLALHLENEWAAARAV